MKTNITITLEKDRHDEAFGVSYYECPNCQYHITENDGEFEYDIKEFNYCPKCGSKIIWKKPEKTKLCKRCQQLKPLDCFGKNKKVCKMCLSEIQSNKNKSTSGRAWKSGNIWSSSHENYLRNNYQQLNDFELADILKRTYFAVRAKRIKLDLYRNFKLVKPTQFYLYLDSTIIYISIVRKETTLTVFAHPEHTYKEIYNIFIQNGLEKYYTKWRSNKKVTNGN